MKEETQTTESGYEFLIVAIFERAIEDVKKDNQYKEDALIFFKSQWSDWLLSAIGSELTGKDVLTSIGGK